MKRWILLLALLVAAPAFAEDCVLCDVPCCEDLEVEKKETEPLLTVTGLFYEESHWSASVTWNWSVCGKVRPTLSYLRLDDQLRSFRTTWHGFHPHSTPVLQNEGVWGFGFTFDIGRKK